MFLCALFFCRSAAARQRVRQPTPYIPTCSSPPYSRSHTIYTNNILYFVYSSVCFRCREVVQVALAAMEAHQRTSALAGSSWAETVAAERVQRQELRLGT